MNTAEQIKAAHVTINKTNGQETIDFAALAAECEQRGDVTQDWDNESTEYDFADGSVLIICGPHVTTYGSR